MLIMQLKTSSLCTKGGDFSTD